MKSISLHPNPIFERESWQSLNGEWDFGFCKKNPYEEKAQSGERNIFPPSVGFGLLCCLRSKDGLYQSRCKAWR